MENNRKTYLVTGGAGFIGSHFVKYLVNTKNPESTKIVVFDALTYAGNLRNISDELKHDNVEFVRGDITDADTVHKLFEAHKPDYVVNFAAESHVDRSLEHARDFLTTNIVGTQTLLEAALQTWKKYKKEDFLNQRFLQVSTDEVYGSLTRDFDFAQERADESGRVIRTYGKESFTETTPLSPRSPYSASKASADLITLAYGETFGLPVLITRCSNNYGPNQFPEKLIPLIINNLRNGKELPVYGLGQNVRDWLYVEDHVKAIDRVLENGTPGEVYNVGGNNELDNLTLVHRIIDIFAELTDTPARHDLIRFVTDRPGHDMRYAIDAGKIGKRLGWYPSTDFDSGIRQTIEWYLTNTEWMEEVTSGDYLSYYSSMYDNR